MTPGGDAGGPAPFVLPGPPPARETLTGWQQWRTARDAFQPAPRLDRPAWRALPPRRRMLYDLHRAATHANLPLQQTPMSQAVTRVLRGRIESNALKHKPSTRAGVMITGGGYQGKTETACEVAADFEDAWLELHRHLNPSAMAGTRDLHAPVAYVQTPVTAKPKSTCKAILGFYGADTKNMDLPDLVRQVAASIRDHGTKALLLDDITRLRMHRADDQDVLDLIRAFMSMHVTLVLIGVDIPGSGLLREGRHDPRTGQWAFPPSRHAGAHQLEATQTERRFDLVELDRFRYDTPAQITAWTRHLAAVEQQLRLMDAGPGMLTDGTMPEYLYRRTNGVVGLLERLIEDGCREAVDTGTERLDQALLDNVALSLPDTRPRRRGRRDSRHPARTSPVRRQRSREASAGATLSSMTAVRRPGEPDHDPGSGQAGPLPRSLDPLPDESLPGYLLRLAHRLGLAPARVMQLTGLTAGRDGLQTARRSLMMHLDEARAGAFSRITRLAATEVSQLCISSMSGQYPWAEPQVTADQWGPRALADPWVFTSATRYCPQCLAGDGSSDPAAARRRLAEGMAAAGRVRLPRAPAATGTPVSLLPAASPVRGTRSARPAHPARRRRRPAPRPVPDRPQAAGRRPARPPLRSQARYPGAARRRSPGPR